MVAQIVRVSVIVEDRGCPDFLRLIFQPNDHRFSTVWPAKLPTGRLRFYLYPHFRLRANILVGICR